MWEMDKKYLSKFDDEYAVQMLKDFEKRYPGGDLEKEKKLFYIDRCQLNIRRAFLAKLFQGITLGDKDREILIKFLDKVAVRNNTLVEIADIIEKEGWTLRVLVMTWRNSRLKRKNEKAAMKELMA
jgi:hypothetical protein